MDAFTKRLGIRYPIIQAPLGGGPGTPELTAAVSNTGALGTLGAAYLKSAEITAALRKIKSLTQKPFGVNLFIPSTVNKVSDSQLQKALRDTRPYRDELELPDPSLQLSPFDSFEKQIEAVLSEEPSMFSFTFGLLDPAILKEFKKANIYVAGTATNSEEALALEESGVDAIIAQGKEAGGHHGVFQIKSEPPSIETKSLVQSLAKNSKLPIIAAGGLMTGRQIAEVIKLGAQAAQLGTAFLACPEAGTSSAYRKALLEKNRTTDFTKVFSGRWARGMENRFMREMRPHESDLLPWPTQNAFTRDLRNRSSEKQNPEFLSLWAGENYSQIREMPVADLVQVLTQELATQTR